MHCSNGFPPMRGTVIQGVGLRWSEHLFFCSGACLLKGPVTTAI